MHQDLFPVTIKATKAHLKDTPRSVRKFQNRQELRPSFQNVNSWKESKMSQAKSHFARDHSRTSNNFAFQSSDGGGSMSSFALKHRQQYLQPIQPVEEPPRPIAVSSAKCNVHSVGVLKVPLTERPHHQAESTLMPREDDSPQQP